MTRKYTKSEKQLIANRKNAQKAGRTTKINDKIINAFELVLEENDNGCLLEDEELVILVNEKLEGKDKFSYSAFQSWQAFARNKKTKTTENNRILYNGIRGVIKKFLLEKKLLLLKNTQKSDAHWQRFCWILERKFDEWNIRRKTEIDVKDDRKMRELELKKQAEEISNRIEEQLKLKDKDD